MSTMQLIKSFLGRRAVFAIATSFVITGGLFVSAPLAHADPTPTTLTIVSPNGGEIWSGTHAITWTSTGGVLGDEVTLVWSTDNFVSTSNLIAENIPYSSGTYSWDTNTVAAGTNYRVRVVAESNNSVFDSSVADFTVDNIAPTISNVTVPDTTMKIGDVVTATITVGDDAGVTYTLVDGAIDGFTLGSLTRVNSTTYTATFTVAAEGADIAAGADIPVSGLVLADTADIPNQSAVYATSISQGSDPIDANVPTLPSVTIASNNSGNTNPTWAKVGDVVTLSFTANEALAGGADEPVVTIAGHAIAAADVNGSGTTWTAVYTMVSGDTEGPVAFTVNFKDIALNSGIAVTAITSGSNVTFDKTNPTILFTQDVDAGPVASDTINLTVTETNENTATYFYGFSADAVCDGTDTYDVAYSSGAPFTLNTETNNGDYICATAVDSAGNTGYSPASANDLNIDVTAPVISSISMPAGVYKIGQSFTVTITSDDAGYTAGTITVNGIAVTGFTDAGLGVYTATYTVVEGHTNVLAAGVPTASVTLKDSSLNENTAFTTVTESGGDVVIDATLPTLSSVTIASNNANPVWAKAGDIVTVSFTADEALAEGADEPVVSITGHVILPLNVSGSGTTWSAAYQMLGGDAQGSVTFTIDFKDVALNAGTQVSAINSGSDVIFDSIAPAAPSITSIAGDNYINNAEKAAVHVVGTAEANSTVSVTLTDTAATFVTVNGSADGAGAYDITLDTTTLIDGVITPTVNATDAAGNTGSNTSAPTATKDVVAPGVSSITTKDTDTNGTVETATIVFNEPVKDSTFSAGDFSIGGAVGTAINSGTADDNTLDVTHAGVASTTEKTVAYTPGIATDIAGNPLAGFSQTSTDSAKPVLLSARTIDTTHILLLFSEDLNGSTVNGTGNEFTASGGAYTVSAASETSDGMITLTVSTMPTDAVPDVMYTEVEALNDLNGNTALTPKTVTAVDGVGPVLSVIHIATSNANALYAKTGDTVTITFTSSETIGTPTVMIQGVAAIVDAPSTNDWTAHRVMTGTDTEGSVTFSIVYADIAVPETNAGLQVDESDILDGSSVLFDRTNPSVDAGTTPKYINIAVTSISQDATVTDGGSGVDAAEFQWTQTSGPLGGATATLDTTEDTVLTSTIDGAYTMELYAEDNAGNSATDTMTLIRDTVSPFVKTYSPTTGKVNVPVTAGTATVTFNENIGVIDSSGAAIVKDSDDSSVASELASVTGGDYISAVLNLPYDTLDTGTTYRFNVNPNAVRDTAGNPFILSFANHFTTEADVTAPIASLTAGSITTTGAVLSATTDEDATCRFSDVDEAFGSMTLFDTTGTTAHETTLAGLTSATTYNFYMRCVDISPAANVMISSAHVSFITAPDVDSTPPDAPVITTANATIDKDTYTIAGTEAADGGIRTVRLYNGATLIETLSLPAGQTTWSTSVSLTQTSANVFTATASDETGNPSAVSNTVTITEATATGDTSAPATPAISGSDEIVDADTYNVSGTAGADLPSDGDRTVTVYRNGTVVGSLSLPAGQTDWSFVSPLLQSTVNNFTAYSTDVAGNPSDVSNTRVVTEQQSDTTPPTIMNSNPADTDTGVSVNVAPQVVFDEPLDPTTVTNASVQLLDVTDTPVAATVTLADGNTAVIITPDTSLGYLAGYHIAVSSVVTDIAGNVFAGDINVATFTTGDVPADATAPVITNIRTTAPIGATSVTITWDTDENANSQVEYGTDSSYGNSTTVDPTMTMSHSVTITGLSADTVYHFRVVSADTNTNSATSADNVFQTDVDDSTAALKVTGIETVANENDSTGFATADDTFENGWRWTFHVTVPTSETVFNMKFADFISGTNSIAAASNIRFYSAQSSDAFDSASAITIAAANTYSADMTLSGDADSATAGRQIEVTVEMKVPTGTAGGSYSTGYGVQSTNPAP